MQSNTLPLPRFSVAMTAAALVTVALLHLMQTLIGHHGPVPDFVPTLRIVDIVRVIEPDEIVIIDHPPRPEPVEPPPPTLIRTEFDTAGTLGIPFDAPVLDTGIDGPTGTGLPDGEMLPIVKVAPAYPQRAVTRGIEGYVLLEFTVDQTGRVEAPKVVESDPPGVFDREALRAVLKFRYKPRVVNGDPVRVEGVLHRLTFELSGV